MTEQENKVLEKTVELWEEFIKLPIQHPDDQQEFKFNLHQLQNQIMARQFIAQQLAMNIDNKNYGKQT